MKKVLFIDRDGTLIREPESDYQIDSLDKFSFVPGVFTYLGKIVRELDYELVMVTNQDGLGTESYPETTFWPYQELMVNTLAGEGIHFEAIHIDRSFEEDNSPYRKPGTKMLTKYMNGRYKLSQSFVIGDRWSDIRLARNLNSSGILFHETQGEDLECPADLASTCILSTTSWKEIYDFLKRKDRIGALTRVTRETAIDVRINLDGSGHVDNNTGLHFFDHMLDQLGHHGGMDISIHAIGDLEIDEHHTIEDVAIALGQTVKQAIGSKVGIGRYGFSLPMDDCLAQVSLDFGGRPWLVWDVTFSRDKVGDMPTEMVYHFFKSFSDNASCNLNMSVTGDNDHHKIESLFKSFARALKQGIKKDMSSDVLPSTKGSL